MGTYNVRTLAFKGTNGIGHAEVILKTCKDAGCDITGSQEMRRDGQNAFTAAGYVVFCSVADGRKYEKKGNHGVGLAVRESIVAGMDKGDVAVECISPSLMPPHHDVALTIPATIDGLTANPPPWLPSFLCFPPSAPEQNTTYPVAVNELCPSRFTSCNPRVSQPASSQGFGIISAWPTPFVPLKASVRTLCIPTMSSPALHLALAPVRIFRVALRNLSRPLLFFRTSDFLPYILRFSLRVFLPLRLPLPSPVLPKCQREGGSSPDTPRPPPCRPWCLLTWVRSFLLCSTRAPRIPRR